MSISSHVLPPPPEEKVSVKTIFSPVLIVCMTVILVVMIAGLFYLSATNDVDAEHDVYVSYLVDAAKWAGVLVAQIVVGHRIVGGIAESRASNIIKSDEIRHDTSELLNGFMNDKLNQILDERISAVTDAQRATAKSDYADAVNEILDNRESNSALAAQEEEISSSIADENGVMESDGSEDDPSESTMNDNSKVSEE